MVSVCLPSDALSQHLLSYLGFSYLGSGVSLHGYSSRAQLLLLTLNEGYLLTATPPDLEYRVVPLGPPVPVQPSFLGHGVAPIGRCPSIRKRLISIQHLDSRNIYHSYLGSTNFSIKTLGDCLCIYTFLGRC